MLELRKREPDAPADPDRLELAVPDQMVDRRPADREQTCRLLDGEEKGWQHLGVGTGEKGCTHTNNVERPQPRLPPRIPPRSRNSA